MTRQLVTVFINLPITRKLSLVNGISQLRKDEPTGAYERSRPPELDS
jgi:hypothetical protein